MAKNFQDTRRHDRLKTSIEVTLSDGKGFYTGELHDISLMGAQVECDRSIEPFSDVKVVLLTSPALKLDGEVRWGKRSGLRYKMGIKFKSLTPDQEQQVRDIIQALFWETSRLND